MKSLTIRDDNGTLVKVDLTPELLKEVPNLSSVIERIEAVRGNAQNYGNSYERSPGHDRYHDRLPDHNKNHSRST